MANNNNYRGHTTRKATISQNSVDYRNLTLGLDLLVSLKVCLSYFRSAASGFNHLLTYMVSGGDSISAIAFLFNVDQHALLDANKLSQDDVTFPFTPILVLLKLPPPRSSYLYHLHHLLLHTPPSYSCTSSNHQLLHIHNTKILYIHILINVQVNLIQYYVNFNTLYFYNSVIVQSIKYI